MIHSDYQAFEEALRAEGVEFLTVGDLAATWDWMDGAEAFVLKGGSVEWESATFTSKGKVRIERLEPGTAECPKYFDRYVDPETKVAELVVKKGADEGKAARNPKEA